jgi:hypothetical protein
VQNDSEVTMTTPMEHKRHKLSEVATMSPRQALITVCHPSRLNNWGWLWQIFWHLTLAGKTSLSS